MSNTSVSPVVNYRIQDGTTTFQDPIGSGISVPSVPYTLSGSTLNGVFSSGSIPTPGVGSITFAGSIVGLTFSIASDSNSVYTAKGNMTADLVSGDPISATVNGNTFSSTLGGLYFNSLIGSYSWELLINISDLVAIGITPSTSIDIIATGTDSNANIINATLSLVYEVTA